MKRANIYDFFFLYNKCIVGGSKFKLFLNSKSIQSEIGRYLQKISSNFLQLVWKSLPSLYMYSKFAKNAKMTQKSVFQKTTLKVQYNERRILCWLQKQIRVLKCSGKKLYAKTMRILSYPDTVFFSMFFPKSVWKHFLIA